VSEILRRIAREYGLQDEEVLFYGQDKAKVSLKALERLHDRPDGKLIVVTGITPTPAGEGKTVTAIGLGDGLRSIGRRSAICLREPSLGPTFGMKGGAAGGGRSQAIPAEDLNLHFTGDSHAVTSAHNLLAAMIEAHLHYGNEMGFDPHGVCWNRVLDVTDRSLRQIVTGLGGKSNGIPRETGFEITAASEIMALLSLSLSVDDLRDRLGSVVVGVSRADRPITARDLNATGAMLVLLRDALLPNLIRTLEETPLFVHTGPFGNIATGCSSILADRLALKLSDYVVTEAGFGSDLGFEKFMHLVAPALGSYPDLAVIVATVRGLKAHSGKYRIVAGKPLPEELHKEDVSAMEAGAINLQAHLEIVRRFGVAPIVAVNRFPTDTVAELEALCAIASAYGAADVAVSEGYALGGEGCAALARCVERAVKNHPSNAHPLYETDWKLTEKIECVAKQVYGAEGVRYETGVKPRLRQFEKWGYGNLPICFAKTQYSLSHDPALRGRPSGFTLPVTRVELAAGAGFVRVFCGEIMTMPGLPAIPAALRMDVDSEGRIQGVI
jgi:formate--tetrahydrofolate ligase